MRKAAISFARLATGQGVDDVDAQALRVVRDAMLAHPEYVAGTGQLDTELMLVGAGTIVSKAGAEGVHGVGAIPQGYGFVAKVVDGSGTRSRTRLARCAATLRRARPAPGGRAFAICAPRGV